MITKPFIELFKQSNKPENANNSSADYELKKILPLFQKLNQIESDEQAPKQLADSIFHAFTPSIILVSTNTEASLKAEQVWYNPTSPSETTNLSDEITGKPASFLCEQTKNTKQAQSESNVSHNYPSDAIFQQLNAETYNSFPLFDENNNIAFVICLIDTQKKAKEYSQFDLNLINSIAQRIGRELNLNTSNTRQTAGTPHSPNEQLKNELEVANKSLESLSYSISHDLRAPLRAMDSFSLILIEDFASDLPDEALNYLSRVRRSSKRMADMIEDLLWLTKVTRRKLERQQVDLSKVAINTLKEIKEKHSEYVCDFEIDSHIMVNADKNLLKIALQHLLNNACRFSQHQKIILLSLTHFEKDDETVYQLSDNGCGFDMSYYDQLFEPFKKLHDGDEYKKGTGIGLATVKRIIHRHGGEIWAESEIDEGTSIFFTLGETNT